MSRSRTIIALAMCLVLTPAFAADNSKELAAAAAHAGMAAGAESPQMVKTHLQHVLNCLEGPKGADYAAVLGNPCGNMGRGALPDSPADGRKKLEDVASLVKRALAEQNIDEAKQMAAEIQSQLR